MSMPTDIKAFNRSIIDEFRANNGKISDERLQGGRLVLLTTTGARSGQPHTVPLGDLSDDPSRIVLWASALAAKSHPAWYHNLAAHPRVTIERKGEAGTLERFEGTAVVTKGTERDRFLDMLKSTRPEIAAHQDQTDREIPLIVIDCPN